MNDPLLSAVRALWTFSAAVICLGLGASCHAERFTPRRNLPFQASPRESAKWLQLSDDQIAEKDRLIDQYGLRHVTDEDKRVIDERLVDIEATLTASYDYFRIGVIHNTGARYFPEGMRNRVLQLAAEAEGDVLLHTKGPNGDVLRFIPGLTEARQLIRDLPVEERTEVWDALFDWLEDETANIDDLPLQIARELGITPEPESVSSR